MQRAEECDGSVMRIGVMTDIMDEQRCFLAEPPWFTVAEMGGAAGDVAADWLSPPLRAGSKIGGKCRRRIHKANSMTGAAKKTVGWTGWDDITLMKVESGRCVIGRRRPRLLVPMEQSAG